MQRDWRERLKSRKFWMSIVSGLLVIANEGLDMGLPRDQVMTFAGSMIAFVLGESYIDAQQKK